MKRLTWVNLIALLFTSSVLVAQKDFCRNYYRAPECKQFPGKGFKYYEQSRSINIGVGDSYLFNLVLFGDAQYKLYFCSSELLLPVHFQILNTDSEKVIYDNSDHAYLNNLTLNIDNTQRLQVLVDVHADEMTAEQKKELFGCMAMMIFARKDDDANKKALLIQK